MPDTDHAKRYHKQIYDDKQEVFDAGMKSIFVFGVLALTTLLVLTFVQRSGRIPFFTQNFLSLLVLIAIVVQAYIYLRQWEAMRHTLYEMRATRELENRAWVGVKHVRFEQIQSGIAINATYINSGNSPALVTLQIHTGEFHVSPPDDFEFPELAVQGSKLGIFPHCEYPSTLALLSKQPFIDPQNPDHAVYILGKLEYKDFFGNQHTTRFCYRPQASPVAGGGGAHGGRVQGGLAVAPTHNSFN